MINVPLIDELRETRRRLSQECHDDLEHYALMLKGIAARMPGTYVTQPLGTASAPQSEPCQQERVA